MPPLDSAQSGFSHWLQSCKRAQFLLPGGGGNGDHFALSTDVIFLATSMAYRRPCHGSATCAYWPLGNQPYGGIRFGRRRRDDDHAHRVISLLYLDALGGVGRNIVHGYFRDASAKPARIFHRDAIHAAA